MFIWRTITIITSKLAILGLRLIGRHGTALPGLMAETMYPGLLKYLAGRISGGVILVTGTNGKTTTAKMLRGLMEQRGLRVLANRSGSNFTRGILASVIEHAKLSGRLDYDIAVFEVDEAYCRWLAEQVKPRTVVVLNVMRDQLDRYGEIDTTAGLIGQSLKFADGAVLNADDPPVAKLNRQLNDAKNTTYYAVSPQLKNQLPSDEELLAGNGISPSQRPEAQIILRDFRPEQDNLVSFAVNKTTLRAKLKFGGVHNAQNAAAALAALFSLFGNVSQKDADSLADIQPAFGRGEIINIKGVPTRLALIKNPSGFNQNIRAFAAKPEIGGILVLINDRYADSRDVSWLWDVDLSPLKNLKRVKLFAGGIRAYDMALRFKYEDIPVTSVDNSIKSVLMTAVDSVPRGQELLVLPTYTAMLEVRKLVSKSSELEEIWR